MQSAPILQVLSSTRGGAAVHVLAVTRGLVAAGRSVCVAVPPDGGHLTEAQVVEAGGRLLWWQPYPAGAWQRLRSLAAIVREVEPALVHAHGSRAAFWSALARFPSGPPLLYSVHGFVTPFHKAPRRYLQQLAEWWITQNCQWLIADAEAERRAVIDFGLCSPSRIQTVHLGFNLSEFSRLSDRLETRRRLGIDPDHQVILNIARFDRPRDFDSLVRAFARLDLPQARLHLVGDGPLRPGIEALVAQLGLQDRVRFWGQVAQVNDFYAACDLYCLTSWGWEGLPVTVIEAQASGLPVVVTDAGGSGEAILPGRSGLLVPRRDPASLARALGQLLTNPDQAREFGSAGREQANRRFTLERMTDELLRLYRGLDQAPGIGPPHGNPGA